MPAHSSAPPELAMGSKVWTCGTWARTQQQTHSMAAARKRAAFPAPNAIGCMPAVLPPTEGAPSAAAAVANKGSARPRATHAQQALFHKSAAPKKKPLAELEGGNPDRGSHMWRRRAAAPAVLLLPLLVLAAHASPYQAPPLKPV